MRGMEMSNSKRYWVEKYTKNWIFYFGFLGRRDVRFGLTLGNREGSVDLFVCTFGYMK